MQFIANLHDVTEKSRLGAPLDVIRQSQARIDSRVFLRKVSSPVCGSRS